MSAEDKNGFDDLILGKMESFEAGLESNSWELFEQKLDAANMDPSDSEDAFDQAVSEKASQFEPAYAPLTWPKMAFRIDQHFILNPFILRSKLIEFSLLVFCLFLFYQNLQSPAPLQSTGPIALDQSKDIEDAIEHSGLVESGDEKQIHLDSDPNIVEPAIVFDDQVELFEPIISSNSEEQAEFSLVGTHAIMLASVQGQNLSSASREIMSGLTSVVAASNSIVEDKPHLLASIETTSPSLLEISAPSNVLNKGIQLPGKTSILRFSMFGAPDLLEIITPEFSIGRDVYAESKSYSLSYSSGFTAGFNKGNWEVETGLVYHAKNYQPVPVLFFNGSVDQGLYGEGFKRIEFNMLGIPLNLKYSFLNKGNWRFYALGGVSAQMVLQSNYYVADQEGFESSSFHPTPVNQGENGSRFTGLDALPVPGGLFEGGSLWDNTLLSANAAVGAERFVTSNWSIFAQPMYQRSILSLNGEGLGPNKDRIHTYSIRMGLRVSLF